MKRAHLESSNIPIDGHQIFTSQLSPSTPRSDGLTLLLLHGAGKSHSGAYAELAEEFAQRGVAVVSLDFIGHGRTGGSTTDNSLAKRTTHALAAVDHWVKPNVPLVVVGSSMSGHTALRVTSHLGNRVQSLGLLQPAVYAADAETLFFTPDFTNVIRRTDSWRTSHALEDATRYSGRALVAIGTDDKVIPRPVIESLCSALKQSCASFAFFELDGVGHELPAWLPKNPGRLAPILELLLDGRAD